MGFLVVRVLIAFEFLERLKLMIFEFYLSARSRSWNALTLTFEFLTALITAFEISLCSRILQGLDLTSLDPNLCYKLILASQRSQVRPADVDDNRSKSEKRAAWLSASMLTTAVGK